MMQAKIIPFISTEALQRRVQELGRSIAQRHPRENILLVSFDELGEQFIHDLKESIGEKARIASLNEGWSITEKWCIVLVHYLIESGECLEKLHSELQKKASADLAAAGAQEPSIFSVSLLQRMTTRKIVREPDYLGFSIPDECVVGYGMDIQGEYGSLPHIAVYDAS